MDKKERARVITYLKTKWDDLFKRDTDNDMIFTQLIEKYMQRGLDMYHTVEHLANMFQVLDLLSPGLTIEERQELSLAIFYHDSFPNERDSKDFMRRSLTRARGIVGDIDKIAQLILATEGHEHTGYFVSDLLVDLDLCILGSTPSGYRRYTQKVAAEFVPEMGVESYESARLSFLKHMEKRDWIFENPVFRNSFESFARSNMLAERKELEGRTK